MKFTLKRHVLPFSWKMAKISGNLICDQRMSSYASGCPLLLLVLLSLMIYMVYTTSGSINRLVLTNSTEERKQPHILLIVADDLGYNDVGYHGSEIQTPVLDKLAWTGIRLENYYVQPICTPTRGALLSGRYQIHTGLRRVIMPGEPEGLTLDTPTLADKLKDLGYRTHIVGKWHLGFFEEPYLPTRRGFESFFGYLSGHTDYFTYVTGHDNMRGFDLRENEAPANMSRYRYHYSTDVFAEKAINIIQTHDHTKPLFLYLPFQAPHLPMEVPKTFQDMYVHIPNSSRRTYAGMVTCMDAAIGRVVEAMRQSGLWENTVLVFTTDNGGDVLLSVGNNYPLRGGKGNYWEGGIRGVGFVHSKLLDERVTGTVSRDLIHVTDWFPTFVGLAGGNMNSTRALDGFNQWKTLLGLANNQRTEIIYDVNPVVASDAEKPLYNATTFYTRMRGFIRVGDWKLLAGFPGQTAQNLPWDTSWGTTMTEGHKNLWLFNIKTDPTEQQDLASVHEDIVKMLLGRMEHYQKSAISSPNTRGDPEANPDKHGGFWGPWK